MATSKQKDKAVEAFHAANHEMENALHAASNVNVLGDLMLRVPVEEDALRERLGEMRDRRATAAAKRLLKADKAYAKAEALCRKLGVW